MRNFTVHGYIINVDGNRITIRVDDADIDNIAFITTFHKKTPTIGNFITVNARTATYDIKNLDWKELVDLKGVHVKIDCTTRVSQFHKKTNIPKGIERSNNNYIPDVSTVKMVSFVAKTIKNVDSET